MSKVANNEKATQKSILFDVMEQALTDAGYYDTEAAVVTVRDLYYSARALYFAHERFPEVEAKLTALYEVKGKTKVGGPAAISMDYFSQTIVPEYEARNGKIERLIRDVRGHLYEPHTGKTIEISTASVWGYEFPEYVFDKMLYIEKEGEMAKVQQARIAERYDMAILTGKGYATEAIRDLLTAAGRERDYQVFVFHDADHAGYNIARTVREETKRMPGYSVDVIDIGLSYADAEAWDCDGEPYARQRALPAALLPQLTLRELELMEGEKTGKNTWRAYRYELNSLKPVRRRMEYIQTKLEEKGVRPKVVPPDDHLNAELARRRDLDIETEIDLAIDRIVDRDRLVSYLTERFQDTYRIEDARRWIEDGFERDRTHSWSRIATRRIQSIGTQISDSIEDAVREAIEDTLNDD